ncbi:MAG: hypothetical protein KZQ93_15795 [Candidatus Thiodiazotropha sp. (ex Monitilora ramsayi)]|nr:hypothetical protein [Candidatus Thiodiazotropha sp. (ex Monitilora ramsayi)]
MSDYLIPKYRYGWFVFAWLWIACVAVTGIIGPIINNSVIDHFIGNLFLAAVGWYPVNWLVKYVYYAYHNHQQEKAAESKSSRLP